MSGSYHRFRRGLALATVVGALVAPAASAYPIDKPIPGPGAGPYGPGPEPPAPTPTVTDDGFDWGDAGIGAAAMLALGAIGAGAVVATGRNSRHSDAPHPAG
jgi:hypothetical protein